MTTDSESDNPSDILLVEDNPGDVRLTREALERSQIDHDLHVVTDGEEALDFLYRRGAYASASRPQLVLLDLNLPKVDGFEVLDTVKSDPDLRHVPVVVLTSSEDQQDVVASYDLHTNAYLTKPSDPRAFFDLVETVDEFWFSSARLPTAEGARS